MDNNTKNVLIIASILIIIGGGFAYSKTGSDTESEIMLEPKDKMEKDVMDGEKMDKEGGSDEGMMDSKDESMMKDTDQSMGAKYVPFTKGVLDSASNPRRVIYFYADWCPTCRPADKDFSDNTEKLPNDVTVIRVNYNDTQTDQDEKDLAAKYGITYQHTFVQIDSDGKEIAKWNGGQVKELLSNIK